MHKREKAAYSESFVREKKITLKQAVNLPHVYEERPTYEALRRWSIQGCWGVRLQARRQGARVFTSAEAVARFMEAMNS